MADALLHPLRALKAGGGGGAVDYGPIIGPKQILIGLASIILWLITLSIINKVNKSMSDAKKAAQDARATAYVNSMLTSSKGMAAARAAMVQRAMPEAAAAYEAANAAAILAGLAPPREARLIRIEADQAEEERIKLMTAQQQAERSDGSSLSSTAQPSCFEALCAVCAAFCSWLRGCVSCFSCICCCCCSRRPRQPRSNGDGEQRGVDDEEAQAPPMPQGSAILASRVESHETPSDASAVADPPTAKQRARLPKRQPAGETRQSPRRRHHVMMPALRARGASDAVDV